MPVHLLEEIVRQIVLADAAAADRASGIILRSPTAMLGKALGGVVPPELAARCAGELRPGEGAPKAGQVLAELTEQVLVATEQEQEPGSVERRLMGALGALRRLAATCLLAGSSVAPRLDLLIEDAHMLDYIARIVYQPTGQGRAVMLGRLRQGDQDIVISSDPNVRGLGRTVICFSSGSPWPLLNVAQRVRSRRTGEQDGLRQWPQSSAETDDLTLSTGERITTRLVPLPFTFPTARGTLQLFDTTSLQLVGTRIFTPNNFVSATFLRLIDTAALPATL